MGPYVALRCRHQNDFTLRQAALLIAYSICTLLDDHPKIPVSFSFDYCLTELIDGMTELK